jgi:hypothetical protein
MRERERLGTSNKPEIGTSRASPTLSNCSTVNISSSTKHPEPASISVNKNIPEAKELEIGASGIIFYSQEGKC